jgi:hypothetical protein
LDEELELALHSNSTTVKEADFTNQESMHGDLYMRLYSDNGFEEKSEFVIEEELRLLDTGIDNGNAYYYSCDLKKVNGCKDLLLKEHINDLDDFNVFYNKLEKINIEEYKDGFIALDTSNLDGQGIILLADNYFKGWRTNGSNEVFESNMGTIAVTWYGENDENEIYLKYLNPYLKPGAILTGISFVSMGVFLFLIRKKKLEGN